MLSLSFVIYTIFNDARTKDNFVTLLKKLLLTNELDGVARQRKMAIIIVLLFCVALTSVGGYVYCKILQTQNKTLISQLYNTRYNQSKKLGQIKNKKEIIAKITNNRIFVRSRHILSAISYYTFIVIALICIVYRISGQGLLSENDAGLKNKAKNMISRLRWRAVYLQTIAGVSVLGVAALLLGGIYFLIYQSSKIAESDIKTIDTAVFETAKFKVLEKERKDLNEDLQYYEDVLSSKEENLKKIKLVNDKIMNIKDILVSGINEDDGAQLTDEERIEKRKEIKQWRDDLDYLREKESNYTNSKVNHIKEQRNLIKENLKKINEEWYIPINRNATETSGNKKTDTSKSDTLYMITVSSIRIGVILVIIFFAQVLLSIYRYSIQLAAYYNGRGDVLELVIDIGIESKLKEDRLLEKLFSLMSAENVNIGKIPKSPTKDILKLMKEINKTKTGGI